VVVVVVVDDDAAALASLRSRARLVIGLEERELLEREEAELYGPIWP
jgi:hypothetical protein